MQITLQNVMSVYSSAYPTQNIKKMYSQLLEKYAARKTGTQATNRGKSVRLSDVINAH